MMRISKVVVKIEGVVKCMYAVLPVLVRVECHECVLAFAIFSIFICILFTYRHC